MSIDSGKDIEGILDRVKENGIILRVEDEKLGFRAPRGALTDELKGLLKAHKAQIIAHLSKRKNTSVYKRPPLSFVQERIWYLQQLEPERCDFTVVSAFHLKGNLDLQRLDQALVLLVKRHEQLRCTFPDEDRRPYQEIQPVPSTVLKQKTAIKEKNQVACLKMSRTMIRKEMDRSFDLKKGPLFRASYIPLHHHGQVEKEAVLLFSMHHIIMDGSSAELFFEELSSIYKSLKRGLTPKLSPISISYTDFAAIQRSESKQESYMSGRRFWTDYLKEAPLRLDQPTDFSPPSQNQYKAGTHGFVFDRGNSERIRSFCSKNRLTPFQFFISIYAALLGRLTQKKEVLVGVPVSNRDKDGNENLFGLLLSTVPVRLMADEQKCFQDLLELNRVSILDAFDYKEIPFEQIVEDMNPPRERNVNPLFQAFFNQLPHNVADFQLDGIELFPIKVEMQKTRFELTTYLIDRDSQFEIEFEYAKDLFNEDRLANYALMFQDFVDACVENPQQKVEDVCPSPTRFKTYLERGSKVDEERGNLPVYGFLERLARKSPTCKLLRFSERSVEAQWVNSQANRLAHKLIESEISGEVIPVIASRNPELFVLLHSILKSGNSFVILDPAYPLPHHLRILDMLKPPEIWSVPLKNGSHHALSQDLAERYEIRKIAQLKDFETEYASYGTDNPSLAVGSDDCAYIAQTSGTTGKPNLIKGNHRALSHFLEWYPQHLSIKSEDCLGLTSGLSHDPLLRDLFVPAATGASLCFPPDDLFERANSFPEWISKSGVSILHSVPSVLQLFGESKIDLVERLRHVLVGGEPVSRNLVERLGKIMPKATFWNVYGTTETPQIKSMAPVVNDEIRISIGSGTPDASIWVLKSKGLKAYPFETGDCYIRTPYLADKYLNGENKGRFISATDRRAHGVRMFKTGDLAYSNGQGDCFLQGRKDRQFNRSGNRIEAAEIEFHLETLDEVARAYVLVEDGFSALLKFRNSASSKSPRVQEISGEKLSLIQQKLTHELPAHKHPSTVFEVSDFPITPTGKIDRRQLLDLLKTRQTKADITVESASFQNEEERIVAEIWSEFLPSRIESRYANFFQMGGHSLLGLRVFRALEEKTGIELPLKVLFQDSSIVGIAKELQNAQPKAKEVVKSYDGQPFSLSDAQLRIWMLSEAQGFSKNYTMPSVLHIHGKLDVGKLEQALNKLIETQPALRTHFGESEGMPWQRIESKVDVNLIREKTSSNLSESINKIIQQSIHITQNLPYRFHLLEVSEEHHVLLAVFHHIISDAWSIDLMSQALVHHYQQTEKGTQNSKSRSFFNRTDRYYTHLTGQHHYIDSPQGQNDLNFWKRELKGHRSLKLTPDFRSTSTNHRPGARCYLKTDAVEMEKLESWAKQKKTSIYAALVSLVSLILGRQSGQDDFTLGLVASGRDDAMVQDLVGCFVNMVPLRVSINRDADINEHLKYIHDSLGKAVEHQRYPFDRLVRELNLNRSLSDHPIFNTAVVYQNTLDSKAHIEGLRLEEQALDMKTAKFDLTFTFDRRADGVFGFIEYSSYLFSAQRIAFMRDQLMKLISGLDSPSAKTCSEIDLMGDREKSKLIEWNQNSDQFPQQETLSSIFQEVCQRFPHRTALVFGSDEMSYQQLLQRTHEIVQALKSRHGDIKEKRVVVKLNRGCELIATFLAVNWLGAAYVPVDPQAPDERQKHIIQDSEPVCIVDATWINEIGAINSAEILNQRPENLAHPEDVSYIIYTSGSTGKPKGCQVLHRNVINLLFNKEIPFSFTEKDVWACCHSFSFDFSVWEMYGALLRGGKLVVAEETSYRDPQKLSAFLRRHQISVLNQTPAAFYGLIDAECERLDHSLNQHLRYIIFGGDRLDTARLKPWAEVYDPEKIQLINMYGITETTVHVTFGRISQQHIQNELPGSPIGRPLPGVQVLVLDEAENAVPVGTLGECFISGQGLCKGYLNRSELNAERFITRKHPFFTQQSLRFYKSGDVVRWRDDGTLEYFGRNDRQVQIRGYRVELGEIESAISGVSYVKTALVLPFEDRLGLQNLIAYLILEKGVETSFANIKSEIVRRLPSYMIPSIFKVVERIPLTANGKVDRKKLPSPNEPQEDRFKAISTSESKLESKLKRIWADYLEHQDFEVADNFFDLGGHSLMLIKMCNTINKELEGNLRIVDLFANPNIRDLAVFMESCSNTDVNTQHGAQDAMQSRIEKRKQMLKVGNRS